ncbi:MAG TPA: hypothetical protein ENI18_09235 [Candidatus Aminicenantes bacterium]|nr:hypothetical protein [Candidatus Aminicenantes bacterium]
MKLENNGNKKRQDFVFDRLGFDLLGIEAKKRLSRSRFIIFVIGFPFLCIGIALWIFKLFEVVTWWAPWPFILVAIGSSIYNHFNLRRSRKLIDKMRETLNSLMSTRR